MRSLAFVGVRRRAITIGPFSLIIAWDLNSNRHTATHQQRHYSYMTSHKVCAVTGAEYKRRRIPVHAQVRYKHESKQFILVYRTARPTSSLLQRSIKSKGILIADNSLETFSYFVRSTSRTSKTPGPQSHALRRKTKLQSTPSLLVAMTASGRSSLEMGPFACTTCEQQFSARTSLTRHVRAVHRAVEQLMCPAHNCGEYFARKDILDRHTQTEHSVDENTSCNRCGKNVRKRTLPAHWASDRCRRAEFFSGAVNAIETPLTVTTERSRHHKSYSIPFATYTQADEASPTTGSIPILLPLDLSVPKIHIRTASADRTVRIRPSKRESMIINGELWVRASAGGVIAVDEVV